MAGRRVPGARLALAGSALWARLTGVDGVDLLYAGSSGLKQFGPALGLRVGLLKEWAGDRSLEALVLPNRFGMTHDVTYVDQFWDPATQQFSLRPRFENNHDQTNTWGLHVEYARPLTASGWRIGWLGTVNRMSHPKLPDYELANVAVIPRDPGHSSAYNVGVGLSKTRGPMAFAIDAICLGLIGLAAGCDGITPPATLPAPLDTDLRQSIARWGVVPIGPMPAQSPALVDLGQALMFDPILSGNRDIACAPCHLPAQHAADGLSLAIGTGGNRLGPGRTLGPGRESVPRKLPSLLNWGLGLPYLFWDGRISRLGFGPRPRPRGL